MIYLVNIAILLWFAFLVRVRRRNSLWVLSLPVLFALAYNLVTPLAQQRVNLAFVVDTIANERSTTNLDFEIEKFTRIRPTARYILSEENGDFDKILDFTSSHPWQNFTGFIVIFQVLVSDGQIVSVSTNIDRQNSRFFSGISTGPDRVRSKSFCINCTAEQR